jgi:hypothetical protein
VTGFNPELPVANGWCSGIHARATNRLDLARAPWYRRSARRLRIAPFEPFEGSISATNFKRLCRR